MNYLILAVLIVSILYIPPIAKAQEEPISIIAVFKGEPDVELFQQYGGQVIRVFKIIPGIHGLMKPSDIERLSQNSKIKYIQIDEKLNVLQEIQWNLQQIRAPDAWVIGGTYGHHSKIQAAILDTGIDCTHPDLAANIAWTPSADPGFPSACPDTTFHGTHVAGIVAALLNNAGVAGVAPEVTIYAILVCPGGSCPISDIVQGIELAVQGPDGIEGTDDDAEVMNMSFGGFGNYPAMEEAINNAYQRGVVSVASAGNAGCPNGDSVAAPARYPTTIAVAATTIADNIASFSSCGPSVDVAAPGEEVLSTVPGGLYGTASGTSMAAPHVTGTVALMQTVRALANAPLLDPEEVRSILHETADDYPPPGFDIYAGYGRIRADRAVMMVKAGLIATTTVTQYLPPEEKVTLIGKNATVTVTQTVFEPFTFTTSATSTITNTIVRERVIIASAEQEIAIFDWYTLVLAFTATLIVGVIVGTIGVRWR